MIGRHARRQPNLRIHEVKHLDIRDVRLHQGFPVTSPARTLIDCASTSRVDRLLNEARALKLVKDAELQAAMDRCPGRKGVAALRALLAAEKETGFTRSRAERILKQLVREAELERPIFNTYVDGVEADAYWPRLKLVVEVDGHQFHASYQAFQRDRAKANKLIAAGHVVPPLHLGAAHQATHAGPRHHRADAGSARGHGGLEAISQPPALASPTRGVVRWPLNRERRTEVRPSPTVPSMDRI